jgi:hypothetical protein
VLALALITGLALVRPAAGESELERLIERTNALSSFSLEFSVATKYVDPDAKPEQPQTIRIDYAAPGRLRVELTSEARSVSYWCIDGAYTLVAAGDEALHAHFDYGAVRARVAEIERAIAAHAPGVEHHGRAPGAAVGMRWYFDDKADKANYQVDAVWSDERRVVLGWLATLRSKEVELRADGERLEFTTDDGRFRGALSAQTGFLEDLWGKSPAAEAHIHLEKLSVGGEIDPARFALPSSKPAGRDVSEDLQRNFTGIAVREVRTRLYRVLAADAGEPWQDEARAKVERALREYHRVAVLEQMAPWLANTAAKKRDGIAERLRKLAETKTATEVAAVREKELGYLRDALDEIAAGFDQRLSVPTTETPLARGDELLAIEREVVARVFDEGVRQPTLAEFERATEPARK